MTGFIIFMLFVFKGPPPLFWTVVVIYLWWSRCVQEVPKGLK